MQHKRILFSLLAIISAIELPCLLTFGLHTNNVSYVDKRRVPQVEETICQHKWEVASRRNERIDLLILGDSSGLMGVDPKILEEHTGLASYNLCTVSYCSILGHAFLLKEYLRFNSPPKTLIYHFAPLELSQDEALIRQRGYLQRTRDIAEGRRFIFPPSLQLRSQVRAFIEGNLFNNEDSFETLRGIYPSHRELCDLLDAQKGFFPERQMQLSTSAFDRLSISSVQLQGLRELTETARLHGIRLMLIPNPIPAFADSPSMRDDLEIISVKIRDAVERSFPDSIQNPFFRFLNARSFSTPNHLHPESVRENTLRIAAFVRKD